MAVTDVILQHQSRARLSDLCTQDGIEANQKHFAPFRVAQLLLVRHASSSRRNQSAVN